MKTSIEIFEIRPSVAWCIGLLLAFALSCTDPSAPARRRDGGTRHVDVGKKHGDAAAPAADGGMGATPGDTYDGGDAAAPSAGDGGTYSEGGPLDTQSRSAPIPIVDDAPSPCEIVPGKLPDKLSCTGLYSDIAKKEVASDAHFFAPAHQLWSDGATKQRWIYLPEGAQIDTSAAGAWVFPVGTKLFKEFSWNGRRVETRIFWKSNEAEWLKTTYHWNDDESDAERFAGGEVDVAGHTYYIPSAKECEQCHKGRVDRALGFELILLGLPGAEGLTLSELVARNLVTKDPQAALEIGDDGTGKAAPALAWLHVNCGISCHNSVSSAEGYASTLRLRLPYDTLDGRASGEFDAIESTVGVAAYTPRWGGMTRVVPGSPEGSLLYKLANTRDRAMRNQMPPIAARVVDTDGMKLVEAWIRSLPAKAE